MRISVFVLSLFFLIACNNNQKETKDTPGTDAPEQSEEENNNDETLSDNELLDRVQRQTFNYFWEGAEPNSGMARERIHTDGDYPQNDRDIVTTGGSGFGVMAILVGVERGFISREEAFERFGKIVDFLEKADRFHGAWPHWINGKTGKVKPFSQKDDGGDLVETAFLVQGLLTVAEYFKDGTEEEQQLAGRIETLWKEVEWDWYTKNGENVLYWHWSPNHAWDMDFPVGGYNECLIMYVLAAASPTHPVQPEVYHRGWAGNGAIATDTKYYGLETVLDHYEHNDDPVGPLFWAHYSYLGLNPKGLSDKYGDYWKLNRNHALINYKYCVDNPGDYKGYGANSWGLTSSYSIKGYAGHHPGHDLGVISPTAALSSFPYTPEESMQMLRFLYQEADSLVGKYGPYDAYSRQANWYVPRYLAIDQGPIPVMIENHRSGLLWKLFMQNTDVRNGLKKLGFTSPDI
ncbi:beta-glucosidase [Sinomicrobium kalidii]|uniref:glucoamylase family protein n=1 Tax=Sinomicrobium kalidii TaxID=2900738 RepID=UPI001E57AE4A|nr:glucoamylase family protein [Sinomicrobium kalidii]UGU16874.1 beta-glucosidase [Sinomicrobium kalidii]